MKWRRKKVLRHRHQELHELESQILVSQGHTLNTSLSGKTLYFLPSNNCSEKSVWYEEEIFI